jgi:hypothetical protein
VPLSISSRAFARLTLILGLALSKIPFALAGPVPTGKPAHYPDWWFERDVIARLPAHANNSNPVWPDHYPAADDYAAVNIGQLKFFATAAAAELRATLPAPGVSSYISDQLRNWQTIYSEVVRDDYAALNQGQLKQITAHFYDRLRAFGYVEAPIYYWSPYPWTSGLGLSYDEDDHAIVNLGQLKHVFSFRPDLLGLSPGPLADLDGDGLPDAWETTHWGNLNQTALADPDGDGINNLLAYQLGLNPVALDHDSDGLTNSSEIARGTDPRLPDTDGDGVNDMADLFPLDPTRSALPPTAPGDTQPPLITLLRPTEAVFLFSN